MIRVGPLLLETLLLLSLMMRLGMGRWPMGKSAIGSVVSFAVIFALTVVLYRPFCGFFMWPLNVVGLGMKYFCTVFAFKCGVPLREVLLDSMD